MFLHLSKAVPTHTPLSTRPGDSYPVCSPVWPCERARCPGWGLGFAATVAAAAWRGEELSAAVPPSLRPCVGESHLADGPAAMVPDRDPSWASGHHPGPAAGVQDLTHTVARQPESPCSGGQDTWELRRTIAEPSTFTGRGSGPLSDGGGPLLWLSAELPFIRGGTSGLYSKRQTMDT